MNIKISRICNHVIRLSYFALFFLTPLIFTSFNSELFEFSKMMLVYVLTIVIAGCWVMRMIAEKRLIFRRTFWDFPLILFFTAITLSTIFSHDVYMSLFGYYSRFHQGLFSLSAFLILYFAFVSNIGEDFHGLERRDSRGTDNTDSSQISVKSVPCKSDGLIRENPSAYINILILTIILSSLIVSIYGICQHFGLDFFHWVQDVQFRVFSSMGQPNWLGAYLAIVLLILFGALLQNLQNINSNDRSKVKGKSEKVAIPFIYYLLPLTLLYTCLLFTRSRSAFTAFHACFFILTIILFKNYKKVFITVYLMFFILINVFNILPTPVEQINELTIPNVINKLTSKTKGEPHFASQDSGASRGEGGTESFAIRKIVWKGAWNTFLANPIFGYGNETFALAYYRYKPIEQNLVSEWDFLYNKAHNEYLNYLATTGIVGFAAYLILIGTFIVYFIKHFAIVNLSLFLAWVTILITNALGFSVVVISLFFYLIPAFMVATQDVIAKPSEAAFDAAKSRQKQSSSEKIATSPSPKLVRAPRNDNGISQLTILQCASLLLILIFTFYLLTFTLKWWLADVTFARAQTDSSQNEYNSAFQEYTRAIELSPYHPVYHSEFSVTLSEMASYFNSQKEKSLAKSLAKKAIEESALAIEISPKNPIFYNYQALVFHNIEFVDKKYSKRAVDSILKSYALSPNDPKITYYMAIYLLEDGQINKALKAFEITEKLKPNYIEAMSNYAKLLADSGKHENARQILEKLLKYYPGNTNLINLLKSYKE